MVIVVVTIGDVVIRVLLNGTLYFTVKYGLALFAITLINNYSTVTAMATLHYYEKIYSYLLEIVFSFGSDSYPFLCVLFFKCS